MSLKQIVLVVYLALVPVVFLCLLLMGRGRGDLLVTLELALLLPALVPLVLGCGPSSLPSLPSPRCR